MTVAPSGSKPTRKYTPLSIVALFFSSVEASLAYSFSEAPFGMQVAIFLFMGLFAVAIAVVFFLFLWHRNWVFYPPSEFASPSVETYINAMRGSSGPKISEVAADSVSKALSDVDLLKKLDLSDQTEEGRRRALEELADEIRAQAASNVETALLRIDARPLKGDDAPNWEQPYDPKLPVNVFLDQVWLGMQPFPPYDYGTVWVLKDVHSGKVFDEIGPTWAKRTGSGDTDHRLLEDVGLTGGMALHVLAAG